MKSYSLEGSTAAALLELCLRSVSARLAQDVSTKLFSDRHVLSAQNWCFHERFFELLSLARFPSPLPRSTHVRHARHERARPRQPPWPFSRAAGLQAHFEALVVWPLRAWAVLMGHPQGPRIMNRQCTRVTGYDTWPSGHGARDGHSSKRPGASKAKADSSHCSCSSSADMTVWRSR